MSKHHSSVKVSHDSKSVGHSSARKTKSLSNFGSSSDGRMKLKLSLASFETGDDGSQNQSDYASKYMKRSQSKQKLMAQIFEKNKAINLMMANSKYKPLSTLKKRSLFQLKNLQSIEGGIDSVFTNQYTSTSSGFVPPVSPKSDDRFGSMMTAGSNLHHTVANQMLDTDISFDHSNYADSGTNKTNNMKDSETGLLPGVQLRKISDHSKLSSRLQVASMAASKIMPNKVVNVIQSTRAKSLGMGNQIYSIEPQVNHKKLFQTYESTAQNKPTLGNDFKQDTKNQLENKILKTKKLKSKSFAEYDVSTKKHLIPPRPCQSRQSSHSKQRTFSNLSVSTYKSSKPIRAETQQTQTSPFTNTSAPEKMQRAISKSDNNNLFSQVTYLPLTSITPMTILANRKISDQTSKEVSVIPPLGLPTTLDPHKALQRPSDMSKEISKLTLPNSLNNIWNYSSFNTGMSVQMKFTESTMSSHDTDDIQHKMETMISQASRPDSAESKSVNAAGQLLSIKTASTMIQDYCNPSYTG